MSKFGWSYPPGAANDPNAPYNQTDAVTDLQETILGLLEEAGISSEINDKIMALLMAGELELLNREDAKAIDGLIADLEEAKRLTADAEIDTLEDLGIPTCISCGQTELYCSCAQFDSERK